MNTKEHWMANAEYIYPPRGRGWIIGEDERADLWVPLRHGLWRRFKRYNPLHWLSYLHSRRRNQVVMLHWP